MCLPDGYLVHPLIPHVAVCQRRHLHMTIGKTHRTLTTDSGIKIEGPNKVHIE